MKLFFVFLLLISSGFSRAEQALLPLYKAEHTMMLVSHDEDIFAMNSPHYNAPYDIQVVYKIETPDTAFLTLVRDTPLVTLKPQAFNIQRLLRGETLTITADVFDGDYKKEGRLVYTNRKIVLAEQLYARKLVNLSKSSKLQQYDMITLERTDRLFIHKIQQAPSYNHLIFVDLMNACLDNFHTSAAVPPIDEITYKFINCGTLKQLYFNKEDFKK